MYEIFFGKTIFSFTFFFLIILHKLSTIKQYYLIQTQKSRAPFSKNPLRYFSQFRCQQVSGISNSGSSSSYSNGTRAAKIVC